jgi:hypothetical protein
MTSLLTLVQKVFTLDSSPRKIVEEVNYFKLLSSSIKMVKDENLLVFSE